MNSFLKNTLFIGILFISNAISAQKSTQVYGQVVDQQTGSPVPFATIALISSSTSKTFTGATTAEYGTFIINTDSTKFIVEINFMGYEKLQLSEFNREKGKINLGVLKLA